MLMFHGCPAECTAPQLIELSVHPLIGRWRKTRRVRGAGGSKRHHNGAKGLPKFQISRTELSASADVASEDGIRCAAASLTYHVAGPWFRG
jgi:hypothetical protein